jgi:hypothetical protein
VVNSQGTKAIYKFRKKHRPGSAGKEVNRIMTYEVSVNLLVTADTEAEAIEEMRKRVNGAEASVFEVSEWD